MVKKYEVMVSYDVELGRDVRCRSDVDTHGTFKRLPNGRVASTDGIREWTIMYVGPERNAKRFAEMIKLGYDGLDVPRYFKTEEE